MFIHLPGHLVLAEMFCDCASEAGAHPHNELRVWFNQASLEVEASLEVGPSSAAG